MSIKFSVTDTYVAPEFCTSQIQIIKLMVSKKVKKLPLPRRERIEVRVNKMELHPIYIPLPLVPSHQGRGNLTFCEIIKTSFSLIFMQDSGRNSLEW